MLFLGFERHFNCKKGAKRRFVIELKIPACPGWGVDE